MQTVGKLDKDGTHIIVHGVKHLLEIIQLCRHIITCLLLLCHHSDKESDIVTKALSDVVFCVRSILHHVMKEGCTHRCRTKIHLFCHNESHGNRMNDVWLASLTLLIGMGIMRQLIRSAHHIHLFKRRACLHCTEHCLCSLPNLFLADMWNKGTHLIVLCLLRLKISKK